MCSAIAIVDGLVDFKANANDDTAEASSIKTKSMDGYEMKRKKKLGGGEPRQVDDNGKLKAMGKKNVLKLSSVCFICEGGHFARDCSKRAQVSAIFIEKNGEKQHT